MKIKKRIDALTSLRFFAAAMIVVYHIEGYEVFGLKGPSILGQGVSFFFVLSGFILARVYPSLETWHDIRRFWHARIARVWPALLASFFLAFWMLSLDWNWNTALANILMVNAWIPYRDYFFSYNAPSWSVSTEFFFYLFFPFIIYKWKNTWHIKLLSSGCILAFMFVVSDLLHSKVFGVFEDAFTRTGLLYISPVTRIFEFIFGMFIAHFKHDNESNHWSEYWATLYEFSSIIIVVFSMYFAPRLGGWIQTTLDEHAFSYWLTFGGSMFAFGFLIYVMAIGKGWISVFLSHPALVLLGEISFSLYMLHATLIQYYHYNIIAFPHLSNITLFTIYWAVLLLSSYLMWAFIEMPARLFILEYGRIKIHGTNVMRQSWRNHLNLNFKTGSAATSLFLLVSAIYFSMDHSAAIYLQRKNIQVTADNLSFYATRDDLAMVKLLIEAGVDVNARNSIGGNALIDAAWAGKREVVMMLLDAKADVNMVSSETLTALNAAISQKWDSLALLLLAHGANPNYVNSTGSSLLIEAAWQGNLSLVGRIKVLS